MWDLELDTPSSEGVRLFFVFHLPCVTHYLPSSLHHPSLPSPLHHSLHHPLPPIPLHNPPMGTSPSPSSSSEKSVYQVIVAAIFGVFALKTKLAGYFVVYGTLLPSSSLRLFFAGLLTILYWSL
ncbi:hypothetical protein BDY19DRAFT_6577 [Irpex rosettiformis]|uniref:Uncharacterized protein n=1 Tax=Irpex rosettiformis TaxID=378272 RepID=A0ACB8UJ71_9APHY|nr:hypothetical protein BDY19DRAFT_6577 [Irpex rosettiformis]